MTKDRGLQILMEHINKLNLIIEKDKNHRNGDSLFEDNYQLSIQITLSKLKMLKKIHNELENDVWK